MALAAAGQIAAASPGHASANPPVGPTDPTVYVACGYDTVVVGGSSCTTLPDVLNEVLANNAASAPPATIKLLPGDYCPINLNPSGVQYRRITIEGVGISAEDSASPIVLDGPEAGVSTFKWSDTFCSGSWDAMISSSNSDWGFGQTSLMLRNLTLDGTNAPFSYGLYGNASSILVEDVIAQNFSSPGQVAVYYAQGSNTDLDVTNTAILDNNIGAQIAGGSVVGSTIAGNTEGFLSFGALNLIYDTITQNTTGIEMNSYGAAIAAYATIVANNTTDCGGHIDWESTSSAVGASEDNVLGTSCPRGASNGDVLWNGTGLVQGPQLNGGPTPTVLGPEQADGIGQACQATDQREYLRGGAPCEIGAYDASGNGTPSYGDLSPVDMGSFHLDEQPPSRSVGLSNSGGGLLDVFSVSATGPFDLSDDSCTWSVLVPSAPQCKVEVTADPTEAGALSGTLTFHTGAGDADVPLSAEALPTRAPSITVATTDDPDGAGTCSSDIDTCSLRQALSNIAPGGTVHLPAGTYHLTQGELTSPVGVDVAGAGARTTTITGDGSDRVFEFDNGDSTLSGVTVTGGSAEWAGGVWLNGSSLTIQDTTISDNTAAYAGGGIENDGYLTVLDSTVAHNAVTDTEQGAGGGIATYGNNLELENSTVADNTSAYEGGAIYADPYGGTNLFFSTVAGNSAKDGGGIYVGGGGEGEEAVPAHVSAHGHEAQPANTVVPHSEGEGVTIEDSVLADNTVNGESADCDGALLSNGTNVASDSSCGLTGAGDLQDTDANLGDLADNGGPTDTMQPSGSSPLVDAANDDCSYLDPQTDQRGLDRPQPDGGTCDIGSVEVAQAAHSHAPTDFDGDGSSDLAVFRPSTGHWYVRNGLSVGFGQSSDVPVPGDYDGDGTTDVAVYRPSTGHWYVRGGVSVSLGAAGDIPVPGDYDGDGTTDVAVYRPSTGHWYIKGQPSIAFGAAGDIPVPGDYDGDGTTDVAVYRPSTGHWYVHNGLSVSFGQSTDIPVPGDYDGDGTTDIAVYRPSTGHWYVHNGLSVSFGQPGDVPVVGDYDGDGTTDIAVYRPSTGHWYVHNGLSVGFGNSTDIPVAVPPAIWQTYYSGT